MAKFLFTVWHWSGHFFPLIPVADALRARGHEIAFYSGNRVRSVVEGEGFSFFPFEEVDEERVNRLMFSGPRVSRWRQPFKLRSGLLEWLIGTIPQQVADLEPILARWQPDCVVCDPTMYGPILVLHEKHRIPVAVSLFAPNCMLPGRDAPPYGLGLPRPRNWYTRLLAWLARAVNEWYAAEFRRAANMLRQRHGLPPLSTSILEFAGQMPLYLVPGVPEFDYERQDLPPSVHYIGATIWNKPRGEPPPAWLEELPQDQPLIYASEGTLYSDAPIVLRAAAQGLANLPMQVIITTGRHRDPAELGLGPIAPNVRVEQWVPLSDLLPRAHIVVTAGGGGTVMATLHAGVPMVVVPTDLDKPELAQRIVESGNGLRLEPHRCTPERLRAAVERVLSKPSFRQNAQRLAAAFARYEGAERAAELLEELSTRSYLGGNRS